ARRAVEPVLLEDGAQPRGEPDRVRAADRPVHVRRVPPRVAVRAHGTPRTGVRALAPRRRSRRRAHRDARDLQTAQRRHLSRRRTRSGHARSARCDVSDPVLPALAQLSERLGRCPDLDTLVSAALGGIADLFGYEHSLLLLLDEDGARLYTIASHGYDT